MYDNGKQLTALRAAFRKHLLIDLGCTALSVAVLILLAMTASEALSPALLATVAAAVVLAVAEYLLERALHRKGKPGILLYLGFLVLPVLLLNALTLTQYHQATTVTVLPFALSFLFIRSLLPTVSLLRDCGRLKEGTPCETVGYVKKNTRIEDSAVDRVSYLLFEDELTHEVHLLRIGSLSPHHRYRVLYLPHSGLAVGEAIPDETAFDPFGTPVPQADSAETDYADMPPCEETEPSAVKPDDTEPDEAHTPPDRDLPDPHSPERQKAEKLAVAHKVCRTMTYVFVGLFVAVGVLTETRAAFFLIVGLAVLCMLLGNHFKARELKIRCTACTTAICVDTVRRRSGKYSHRYPIVEFEVDGVTYTAELSTACSPNAVGEPYTVYYDPLDPKTVIGRAGIL